MDETKTNLVHLITRILNIPERDILFVFDDSDYEGYINPTWSRKQALHMNLALGGIEEMSPEHLLKLMGGATHAHLVWFSKKACQKQPVEFSWIVAHEMQHLLQDMRSHTLSRATYFLMNNLNAIDIEEPRITITVPAELEAERTAREIVTEIFGEVFEFSEIWIRVRRTIL